MKFVEMIGVFIKFCLHICKKISQCDILLNYRDNFHRGDFLNVAILAIGNEVLCGKIVDTNGAIISREIEKAGAKVVHREVVLDTIDDIVSGLRHAYEYADFVITIGGLGPTVDDLTREGVARFFNEDLVYEDAIYQDIVDHFNRMSRATPTSNKRQAYKFAKGSVLRNSNGTAPGLALDKDGKKVFLLPGPPNEIFPMFDEYVLPVIKGLVDIPLITRSYRLYAIGESPAEERIIHLYEKYPTLDIAPYASISFVDYIVMAKQSDADVLDTFEEEFLGILGEYCVGSADVSLNAAVVEKLKLMNMGIAVAESCTGGMLASAFVDVPGVSDVFLEGLVVYSNEAKVVRLGVDAATIERYGAVSRECAREMVVKLQSMTGADVTVSTTGIAGPSGGTDEKPVGTVYIGICIGDDVQVYLCRFTGSREKIRVRSKDQVLYLLYKMLNISDQV